MKSRYKLLVACEVQVISQSITKACSLSGCLGKIGLVGSPSSPENCATSFGLYFQSIFFSRITIQTYKWLMQYMYIYIYFFFLLHLLAITNQVVVQLGYHNQILCGRWKATSVMKNRFWHQLQLVCIGGGVLHRHCVDFCPKWLMQYMSLWPVT